MTRAIKAFTLSAIAAGALAGNVRAQQPTPPLVIVQPANAAPVTAAAPAPASAADAALLTAAIKALEQVKAANEATLKKQETMLQQLDELQKGAEQLKVFSKRT